MRQPACAAQLALATSLTASLSLLLRQVGDTKLYYSVPTSSQYFFNLVISNTRVPVAGVSASIGGKTVALKRSSNNNWAYHNSHGTYSFPMEVTITPVCGAAVCPHVNA